MLPIKIYISCNQLPRTSDSLDRLLEKISNSSLNTASITIVHSIDWDCKLNSRDLTIEYVSSNLSSQYYEFPTLQKVKDSSQLDNYYGLYLHVKGASKTDELEWQNALAWQDYMTHGVIDCAEQCIEHLDRGADYVGSQWHWHWKGNFFWFRSQYVRQLVDPMAMDLDYRNNCEHWSSYSYWWGRYPLPRIKNLYYLPLETDQDYLKLKNSGYKPQLGIRHIFDNTMQSLIEQPWYGAYDVMRLSNSDIQQYPSFIAKYLNYDSVVVNKDTGEQYDANSFLY